MPRPLSIALMVIGILLGLVVVVCYVIPAVTRADAPCYQAKQAQPGQPTSLECTAGLAGRRTETRTQETTVTGLPDPATGDWVATFAAKGEVTVKADARPASDGTLLVVVRTPAAWGDLVALTHR